MNGRRDGYAATSKCQVASTRLGDVEYRSIGKGIPILFVHGGHSNCKETLSHKGFDPGEFRLITPSRPGYGRTPLGGRESPERAADLIAALMDHLSLGNAVVYGISAGGPTAIELARNHPGKVRKLILASAVSMRWLDADGTVYRASRILFDSRIEKMTWGLARLLSSVFPRTVARGLHRQFCSKRQRRLRNQDVEDLFSALRHYSSGRGFLNDIDQTVDDRAIAEIGCPTLIIHSRHDASVPFIHALHARALISDSSLMELDNEWGHLIWLGEHAITWTGEIARFAAE